MTEKKLGQIEKLIDGYNFLSHDLLPMVGYHDWAGDAITDICDRTQEIGLADDICQISFRYLSDVGRAK